MPVTLIHSPTISEAARRTLLEHLPGSLEPRGRYHRLHHERALSHDDLARLRDAVRLDINTLPEGFVGEQVQLVMSDMDSTLINIECIDEIADHVGLKPQVAAITEAAMRGELNFQASLTQRVALLKGLPLTALEEVYNHRLRLNPGAERLIRGLHAKGIRFALVSGGFTFFSERLRERLGIDFVRANVLGTQDGRLLGFVEGEIVGPEAKHAFLGELCARLSIDTRQAVAMGDGANDLPMMQLAGLGVAYRAKPKVQAQADVVINHAGLDAVLDLLDIAYE